jgi:hypothetical protein
MKPTPKPSFHASGTSVSSDASDLGGQIDKVNHHRYAAIILSFVAALRT